MERTLERPIVMKTEKESAEDIRQMADFLDTKFKLPFGWRIGWDGLIGLIPGVGDVVTNVMSFYILYRAAILGCPLSVVLRMGLNLLIDNLLDTLPLIGNIFDFVWKANSKNLLLLNQFLQSPHRTTVTSRAVVFASVGLIVLMVIAMAVLTFYLARWFWGLFQSAW